MTGDAIRAKPLGEMHRQPLAETPGVHKHQRRAMLRDQLGDPGVDLFPNLRRHHRLERRGWDLQLQIQRADVAGVDNRGQRLTRSDQELSDLFDRPLRS